MCVRVCVCVRIASPRSQTLGQVKSRTSKFSHKQILAQAQSRKQILAQAEDRASLAQANLALASRKQILVAGLIS